MALTRPTIIQKPFAESGDKNIIPIPSQVGIVDGAASWVTGFPPDTLRDIGDGGIAPDGLDFNGLFNIITQHIRFMNAGGYPRFDATLCTEIGGYPVGVILQDNAGINLYRNVSANNTTNFNTTPASIGSSWIWLAGAARNITAGAGMVGGGSMSGDVNLDLGTPETCSGATTNTASADSHTHNLAAATSDVAGVIRIGTNADTYAGASGVIAVAPAGLAYVLTALFGKRSFSAIDFLRIPDVDGGLIVQWGYISALSTDGTSSDISFPITFPHSVLHIGTTHFSSGIDGNPVSSCSVKTGYTLSSFKLMQDTAKGSGVSEFWFAIGF